MKPHSRRDRSAEHHAAHKQERRSQLRALLYLAGAVLLFTILRAGIHRVFTVGWWRP